MTTALKTENHETENDEALETTTAVVSTERAAQVTYLSLLDDGWLNVDGKEFRGIVGGHHGDSRTVIRLSVPGRGPVALYKAGTHEAPEGAALDTVYTCEHASGATPAWIPTN